MKPFTKQQLGLAFALLATLWLTFWGTSASTDQSNNGDIVLPARTLNTVPQNAPIQADLTLLKRQFIPTEHNLLTVPPAPIIVATQKPMAQKSLQKQIEMPPPVLPLPFKYLGRWQTAELQSVSLDYQGEVLTVQAGDTIDGQYQVTKIAEVVGGLQIQFLSLRNNQLQTMQIGAVQ
jgi:hypothetical protein